MIMKHLIKKLLTIEKIQKSLRMLLLILLIFLASIGVGMSGGVPIPIKNKKDDSKETQIELVEEESRV
jgi:hypothetical protein